ncbi:MAG: helix-turn-helix domain-containing protein [archaeon]
MWVVKIKIRHDSIIAELCRRFGVVSHLMTLGNWQEGRTSCTSERHTLEGDADAVKAFLEDLKADRRVSDLEIDKDTIFFVGKTSERSPYSLFNPRMFYSKPIYVDKMGLERWEVASFSRDVLSSFIEDVSAKGYDHCEIGQLKEVSLNNICFPAIMPDVTARQKRAFGLAVELGYYDIPKKIHLAHLAKMSGVSIATFQEHLKRTESKILPRLSID